MCAHECDFLPFLPCGCGVQFEFIMQDIAYLEPKVKCMHIVDFGTGIMLEEFADSREKQGGDQRTIRRMRALANEHFAGAERMLPSHSPTMNHRANVQQSRREA